LETEHFSLDLEQCNEQERNQELFIGHFGFYSILFLDLGPSKEDFLLA
jgi:hypothetical protein